MTFKVERKKTLISVEEERRQMGARSCISMLILLSKNKLMIKLDRSFIMSNHEPSYTCLIILAELLELFVDV